MKKIIIFIMIILILILIFNGCVNNKTEKKNYTKNNLELTIETNKYQFSLNESIILVVKLLNNGTNDCSIDWHDRDIWLHFNLEIHFPNGIIAYNEPTGNQTYKNINVLKPNEYKEYSINLLKTTLVKYAPDSKYISMNITGKYSIEMLYHGLDFNIKSNEIEIEIK
jgi:hypothetical protein